MGMAAAHPQFHVLAVDDSLIDRKLIERLLKTSSYQVTTVDSGSKALEFLGWHGYERSNSNETSVSPKNQQEIEINLVITDYCMPEMTGYDLLKKMKESSILRSIPVVIMSSENVPSRINRVGFGANSENTKEFYAKEYNTKEFVASLLQHEEESSILRSIPVVIMSSENVPSRINRCLEEGAEEFFLKPVRLSDVNKLKPHIMKTKCKELEKEKRQENKNKESPSSSEIHLKAAQSEQQQTEQSSSNKRKSIDERLSPDRTRPRYNDLSVISN